MSSPEIQSKYVVRGEGICDGQPRIAGTRLKIQSIAMEYGRLGWTPDQICESHPGITLAQVHAALSYYYDHREEIDLSIHNDKEFSERLRSALT
jgi:uncharacterized protein (DUF433 family)